jgi:hypothetical protein
MLEHKHPPHMLHQNRQIARSCSHFWNITFVIFPEDLDQIIQENINKITREFLDENTNLAVKQWSH